MVEAEKPRQPTRSVAGHQAESIVGIHQIIGTGYGRDVEQTEHSALDAEVPLTVEGDRSSIEGERLSEVASEHV